MGKPEPLFVYFLFSTTNFTENCGFRTQLVGVEGEHADHLTTTTARRYHVTGKTSQTAFY